MEVAMKYLKWAVLTMLIGWTASGAAWADHGFHSGGHHFAGRANFGVFIGPGFGWPWYYGPYNSPYYSPYYYYPPAVSSGPQVYVEEEDVVAAPAPQLSAPAQQPGSWWYFCQKTQSYYPYVKVCPGGWQKVAPQPPTQ
jgi:hypothetical protein